MKMIVGLGNIGAKYDKTRHNTGFMVVDALADKLGISDSDFKFEHKAMVATTFVDGQKIMLVKPTTYMNESGQAVRLLMDYYDIDLSDVLVVYDDMDMALGKIRLRAKGSAGGHNGIKSIIANVGTPKFQRVRVGIEHPSQMTVVDYVLGHFNDKQIENFKIGLNLAVDAIYDWILNPDFNKLMNQYN